MKKELIKKSFWEITMLFAFIITVMGATGAITFTDDGIDSCSSAYNLDVGGENISNADTDIQIGDGTAQVGIVMTSPDGTEYTCTVADGGAFSCS